MAIEKRRVVRCMKCRLRQFENPASKCVRCHHILPAWLPFKEPPPPPEPPPLKVTPLEIDAEAPEGEIKKQLMGQRLQFFRVHKGWSQRDFAKKSGYQSSYISRVENGLTMPTARNLQRFAKTLDVPVDKIIPGPWAIYHEKQQAKLKNEKAVMADPYMQELLPYLSRLPHSEQRTIERIARSLSKGQMIFLNWQHI